MGSIVARSSGIVTHIEPLSGEALVAQGDTVLAGEVLISGAVTLDAPQYSELENLGQILVRAQGQVFARTWHTMTASIPLEAQVKSYTGEKASRWTLSILGHRIDFFGKSGISFPEYDKITDTWALTLPGGREMPLALSRETCRAYTLAAAPVDADAAGAAAGGAGCWRPFGRGWETARWCIPASPPHSGMDGWRSPSRPSARRRSGALCRWSLLQKKMRPNHDRTDHQHRAH